jgi:hypothetical protein
MIRYLFLAFVLVTCVTSQLFAEEMTLTTYYPAPSGSYMSMRSTRMCIGQVCHTTPRPPVADNDLYIQNSLGIGTVTPTGALDVNGGTAAFATDGTNITLRAQNAGTGDRNGGDIILIPGAKAGTGHVGSVCIGTSDCIGTTDPLAALDVRGDMTVSKQIRSVPADGSVFQTAATAIDWDNGNVIVTTASCPAAAMAFSNMKEGGAYTLIVTGATAGTCTFNQAGIAAWKFSPLNGATTASTTTTYTFLRARNTVYVSWIKGF